MLRIVRALSCHGAGVLVDTDLLARHLCRVDIVHALTG
jgi:hypothetical protein